MEEPDAIVFVYEYILVYCNVKINGFLQKKIISSSKNDKNSIINQVKMKKINNKDCKKINSHKKIHKNPKIFTVQKVKFDCKIMSNKMTRIL